MTEQVTSPLGYITACPRPIVTQIAGRHRVFIKSRHARGDSNYTSYLSLAAQGRVAGDPKRSRS